MGSVAKRSATQGASTRNVGGEGGGRRRARLVVKKDQKILTNPPPLEGGITFTVQNPQLLTKHYIDRRSPRSRRSGGVGWRRRTCLDNLNWFISSGSKIRKKRDDNMNSSHQRPVMLIRNILVPVFWSYIRRQINSAWFPVHEIPFNRHHHGILI